MVIVTKINPGPRTQLIGALPPFLTQPQILLYHKDDIQLRVSQFNDWCQAASVQQDFCQMYEHSKDSKVTTCKSQKGDYLCEYGGLRLCQTCYGEFRSRGGPLRSVRRTEDKANAMEIYMSPDHENGMVVDINFEKLRHSLQHNYVDTYGCVYDNPGDGKGKFIDVKTHGLRRNIGETKDPRQRNEDKPDELGADLSNAGFLGKFREKGEVEGMTHGFLKAMGLHIDPNDRLN
ncbi:hypothetical protein BGZ52_008186 [Haplosporangium bisporale]|nr:hypothetical protein BGZ52_008186 [Haplosporangium bisporale]